MKRKLSSARLCHFIVLGAALGASAAVLSCSSTDVNSNVQGGPDGTGATSSTGGAGSTGGASSSKAGSPMLGGLPGDMPDGPCMGLECQVPACPGMPTTSISGKVYDPAGKVPLYNVMVYVPNAPVPAFTEGAACDRCGATISNPVTAAVTDETGSFKLDNAPAGANVPVVIQVGKWRRQITVPNVAPCADTALADPQLTRLPRNKSEGDLPRIAISAGGADQMECLPLRLGVDPAEFTDATGDGRIHLFTGHYNMNPPGDQEPEIPLSKLASGATLTSADTLWQNTESLMKYDIVILSCEGATYQNQKPMQVREAMYEYASRGGRVFASHWHNVWFANGPEPVPTTGTWTDRVDPIDRMDGGQALTATVNQTFPKGEAFAKWLVNVGASTTAGQLDVTYPRDNLQAVNPMVAREWITVNNPRVRAGEDPKAVQYMSFNTPIGVPEEQVCGRAVYTDLHVAGVDNATTLQQVPFPGGCEMRDLSAQEKAVAFMLFDLSSCVQSDEKPPQIPK